MIKVEKKILRKDIITKRKLIAQDSVLSKSLSILENLKNLNLLENANHIMLYMDFRNEVATSVFIEHLRELGKSIYIPRVNTNTKELEIYLIESDNDLILSDFGILEPNPQNEVQNPKVLDLILSPGVAFTKDCYRLGYGGGFYDRFLTLTREDVITAALSFSMQIVDSIPLEEHDKQLDYVITEDEVYKK